MTNEYGLTIDHIAAYELVLPNGTITNVTSSDKALWFALRVSDLEPDRETLYSDHIFSGRRE
jgi:hypothetical protein